MGNYTSKVMREGELYPTRTLTRNTAADVIAAIPEPLEKHPGYHRVHVYAGVGLIFSVDCGGKNVTD